MTLNSLHLTAKKIKRPIERLSCSDTKHLKNQIATQRPFVVNGLVDTWPAKKWCFDYFNKNYGHKPVEILIKEDLTYKDEPVLIQKKKTTLKDYIDSLLSKEENPGYLAQTQLQEIDPELLTHFKFPKVYPHKWLTSVNLWIGPSGTKSKLHFDSDHNLFVQIAGKKRVTLISPDDSTYCYPVNRTWYDGYSPVDVENPDYLTYPLFAKVHFYSTDLNPGDVLFIPRGWWHDVRSLTPSISLNFWWVTWPMFFKEIVSEIFYYLKQFLKRGKNLSTERKNSYLHLLKKRVLKEL